MPFDDREVVLKAIKRFQEEFVEILAKFAEMYPDVARRGINAMFAPRVTMADNRSFRKAFANAQTPEEFMSLLEQATAARSETEVAESFVPARRSQSSTEREEGIDAYGPRI